MKFLTFWAVVLLMAEPLLSHGADGPFEFEFREISSGVWTGIRPDGPRFPVMGNVTFVISSEGVVVFDGGGMPAMSEQVISKIRSLTSKSVTHVVTSHWHGDHNFGVFRFGEEYRDVQFIAHQFTDDVMNSARMTYIDRERGFIEKNMDEFHKVVATGKDSEGTEYSERQRGYYSRIIDDAELIDTEFNRARVTAPNRVFTKKLTIESGERTMELLHLGHGNTAGDIVMWLPKERIVATGDLVVLPSPYAFNVPPRAWANSLRALNELDYTQLIPGHGDIQTDTAYVDLIIEAAESIADQRDEMLSRGMDHEEIEKNLDFTDFEQRFTLGDEYIEGYYDSWFEGPFRKAAVKALSGEPMVEIEPGEQFPIDDERWKIEAVEHEIVDYLGQRALRIRGGAAMLPDLDIQNGVVEFDIAVSSERGFAGLIFRSQDIGNYEHFYIRPHQSGNPDANQYTPAFNGVSAWQLYHGDGYGAPVEYAYDRWMSVKIIYAGSKATVYIDSDKPVLKIDYLKRKARNGSIGLHSANFSAVHFANVRVTELADAFAFPSTGPDSAEPSPGMVTHWRVSDSFDKALLQGATQLGAAQKVNRSWTELNSEPTGITNLAQVQGLSKAANTVFARFVVSSDTDQLKVMDFGYSDIASVYLNDTLIYRGDNTYLSRDYRFLGTIGLFDSVVLPLHAGDNELWIAVSEAFGGWGVMATIKDGRSIP